MNERGDSTRYLVTWLWAANLLEARIVSVRKNGSVMVFVDSYVTGNLPEVCVITGESTVYQVMMRTQVKSLGWWFLLFLPVVGWMALLAAVLSGRTTVLSGSLPFSAEARKTRNLRRRSARYLMLGGVAVFVLAVTTLTGLALGGLLGIAGLAAVIFGAGLLIWTELNQPTVTLDASRRWVTIEGVHPRFVEAVESQNVRSSHRS